VKIRDKSFPATHTTPDIVSLYNHLDSMVKAGCQYVFMEVSSHALDQKRVAGLKFSGAVFTNISRDHLDYHEDFASYIKAKKRLFDELTEDAFAIVNEDDRNAGIMLQNCRAIKKGYSTRTISDFHGKLVEQINQGMMLQMNGTELWVPFIGRFNVSNITGVYGVAISLGWNNEEILTAISSLKPVEGRFEKVDLGDGITGIVDYAHTPDALENVLESIREMCAPGQRVLTVIGAGGDRDRGKRPAMAAAACALSEIVILTSDNPRSEDPGDIIQDMKEGVPVEMEPQVFSIINRHEAIKLAYALAREGDFVLVAGKGHETYQEIKGERKHFDDKEELLKIKSSI
jgi:UDP-N-acetylmuramoyl-L-alanyl-D-glutamate--2,6-diaminopimelate ligase